MNNQALAQKIYEALREKGVVTDSIAVTAIEALLNEYRPDYSSEHFLVAGGITVGDWETRVTDSSHVASRIERGD